MRGHSSSHTAAFARIGLVINQMLGKKVEDIKITYNPKSSLAETFESQGAFYALIGGILGLSVESENLKYSLELATKKQVTITHYSEKLEDNHPNACLVKIISSGNNLEVLAKSTGGGMVEIIRVNNFRTNITLDKYYLISKDMNLYLKKCIILMTKSAVNGYLLIIQKTKHLPHFFS